MGTTTTNGFLYKPTIGASGSTEKSSFDAGLDRVDARLGKEIFVTDPLYGAKGDGVTDDTAAFVAAIAAASTAGAVIKVPPGTYKITTGQLNISSTHPVMIEGMCPPYVFSTTSQGGTVLVASGVGAIITGVNMRGGGIKNLVLDGNSVSAKPLDIQSAFGSEFRNLEIRNSADIGFRMVQSAGGFGNYYNVLENVRVFYCAGPGFYFHATTPGYINSNVINGLTASGCGTSGTGTTSRYGYDFSGVYNSTLLNCTAESNLYDHGFYADQCENIVIQGGLWENNGSSAGTPANKYQIYFADTNSYQNGVIYATVNAGGGYGGTSGVRLAHLQGQLMLGNPSVVEGWPSGYTNGRFNHLMKQGGLICDSPTTTDEVLGVRNYPGHSYPTWVVTADGKLNWRDPDTAAPDITLYRSLIPNILSANTAAVYSDYLCGGRVLKGRTLASSASGALDLSSQAASYFEVNLTENITGVTFPNGVAGEEIRIRFLQASGASYTVTGWPGNVKFPSTYTMTSTHSKADVLTFQYDHYTTTWYLAGVQQGM